MLKEILRVFSKEYQEETKYWDTLEKNKHLFALSNDEEDGESKIQRMKENNIVSNCSIKICCDCEG